MPWSGVGAEVWWCTEYMWLFTLADEADRNGVCILLLTATPSTLCVSLCVVKTYPTLAESNVNDLLWWPFWISFKVNLLHLLQVNTNYQIVLCSHIQKSTDEIQQNRTEIWKMILSIIIVLRGKLYNCTSPTWMMSYYAALCHDHPSAYFKGSMQSCP